MYKVTSIIIPAVVVLLAFLVFRGWIGLGVLSTGDWPYLFPQAVSENVPFSSWDPYLNGGLGQGVIHQLWFNSYSLTILEVANFIPWPLFERLVWFFPYIIISFLSSFFLARKIGISHEFALMSGIIYSTNTYILMIVAGGQVGVMMAYAFLPFVFHALLNLAENISLRKSLIFSLSLSFLVMLDLRVAYMFLLGSLFFYIWNIYFTKKPFVKSFVYIYLIPGIISMFLHSFWILPVLILGSNPVDDVPAIYTSAASLDFFSFAKFENSISLLHPNWPENIFGKVSFLKPEFLLIPILAFVGLIWVNNEEKEKKIAIILFAALGIIGIFLSKGTNEPYGEIYRFLFDYIPGFVMFRDPTKWYMLIAVSFSILIAYSISNFGEKVGKKYSNLASFVIPLVFIIVWGMLIRDAVAGNIGGTLSPQPVPESYMELSEFIVRDDSFYRTLWVPSFSTFAYNSVNNPAIRGNLHFGVGSASAVVKELNNNSTQIELTDAGIRYVIVPEDTMGNIFVTDREYDEDKYQEVVALVRNIDYLKEVAVFGKNVVFEVPNPKNRFWSPSSSLEISYEYVSPTKYIVEVKNAERGDIVVFAENYDAYWYAVREEDIGRVPLGNAMPSSPYSKNLNSFSLKEGGDYKFEVFYLPQKYVEIGIMISAASLILIAGALIYLHKKK